MPNSTAATMTEDHPATTPSDPVDEPANSETEASTSSQPRKRRVSHRVRWIIIAVAVIAAIVLGVVYGWPYYEFTATHASTDDAFIAGDIVPISPRVAGHVKQIYVVDNQYVEKGQLLAMLDPAPFQDQLAAAKANLAVAEANHAAAAINTELTQVTSAATVQSAQAAVTQAKAAVDTAQARVQAAGSALAQAKAQIIAAQATAKRDQLDLNRYRMLRKSGAVSPQLYDHAVAAAQAAQAQVTEAKAAAQAAADMQTQQTSRLAEAKASLQQAQADLAKAQSAPKQVALSKSQQSVRVSQIAQAQAAVQQAELNLQYTKIYAPVSGNVTKKSVEPGQYLVPGQVVMSVVPTDVWIKANYKETQLAPIRVGQPVNIDVDAYPDHTFHGHVQSIMSGTGAAFSLLPPENATGNYIKVVQRVPVKIVFDPQPNAEKYHLAPGMSVVPYIDLTEPKQGPRDQGIKGSREKAMASRDSKIARN